MSFRIKRDDVVEVITGRAGQDRLRGKVLAVYPKKQQVIVEGINLVKRHERIRESQGGQEGGIIEREAPIHISNVMLVDPKTDLPTRVGSQVTEEGVKQRVAKKSGTPV